MHASVEAPEELTGPGPSLFLAGSITGCPDVEIRTRLARAEVAVVYTLSDLACQVRKWLDAMP